jgi:uncharacterized protein
MTMQTYLNLPVRDLDRSVDFFTKLGFAFNPQFTDENATCMIINDHSYVMLLVEDFFKSWTKKDLCDARTHTEAIIALSADSRQAVDELINKALQAGAQPANDPMNSDGMYGWSFQDLDGHQWEVVYMDPSALER